jgi:hypothetical protein
MATRLPRFRALTLRYVPGATEAQLREVEVSDRHGRLPAAPEQVLPGKLVYVQTRVTRTQTRVQSRTAVARPDTARRMSHELNVELHGEMAVPRGSVESSTRAHGSGLFELTTGPAMAASPCWHDLSLRDPPEGRPCGDVTLVRPVTPAPNRESKNVMIAEGLASTPLQIDGHIGLDTNLPGRAC